VQSLAASHRLAVVVEDLDLVLKAAAASGIVAALAVAQQQPWRVSPCSLTRRHSRSMSWRS